MMQGFLRRAFVAACALSMIGTVFGAAAPADAAECGNLTIALTPATQTVPFNQPANVTATVADSCGPVSGAPVTFTSVAGTNAGQTTSSSTNAAGTAVGTFTSSTSGADAVRATSGTQASTSVLINWAVIQQGRAYSLQSAGLVPIAPQQDTGVVSRIDDYSTGQKCAASLPAPTALGLVCNQVLTGAMATSSPKRGTLTISSIKTAVIAIPGVPVITATGLSTFAGVQCDLGPNGVTNIATLKVGLNALLKGGPPPAPNTVIPLGAGSIILNEQKPVPGALGVEVNAIHVVIPGVADVVVSSAMASLIGCPTAAA
jgi:hypothetical protein